MITIRNMALGLGLAVLLAGCGSTTTTEIIQKPPVPKPGVVNPVGGASQIGSLYTVRQAGRTIALPSNSYTSNGQRAWGLGGTTNANSYAQSLGNVLAIGGVQNGQSFAGITGTRSLPPVGNATYTGRYAVNRANAQNAGPLVLNLDVATGKITDSTDAIDVVADVSGRQFNGTVTHDGDSAVLQGGFYGPDNVAGAFNGGLIGGVIYGAK